MKAVRKIKGGKLILVELWLKDRIEKVLISGDFFLYPEEGIEELENSLVGLSRDAEVEEIKERIEEVLKQRELQPVGFGARDLAEVVKEALECGDSSP